MSFIAECSFCRLTLQSVPDHRLGDSVECPRCRNAFTLAPKDEKDEKDEKDKRELAFAVLFVLFVPRKK